MDSGMTILPFEMIEQILLRIPARSLIPLKIVCKQWGALISDPRFVKNHLNRSMLDKGNLRHRVVCKKWRSNPMISSQAIDYQQRNHSYFELPLQSLKSPRCVLASCDGLLLLGNSNFDEVLLWNPLFREKCKYLPPRKLTSSSHCTYFVGFGYVSAIDDYKVVALSSKILSPRECSPELQVEIYSLKANSWRTLLTTIPYAHGHLLEEGTHVQGSIHWIVYRDRFILSFNLTTERYKFTRTPRDYNGRVTKQPFALAEIGGHLCAYQSTPDIPQALIWAQKKGVWCRPLVIPTNGRKWIQCLQAVSNNELLLNILDAPPRNERFSKYVIWNLKSKTFRDKPSAGVTDFGLVVHMVETIVSPDIW